MYLNQELFNRALIELGYGFSTVTPEIPAPLITYPGAEARIEELLDELLAVDAELKEARPFTMAKKSSNTEVDYQFHVGEIRRQGSQLLKYLSQLVGYPIQFNRFTRPSSLQVTR